MASSNELHDIFETGRPLIEQWLDIGVQIAGLRDLATEKGFDWSQIKALLKARIQDERDGDTKRVDRLVEKAEFATAYAGMLGFMNEDNYSADEAANQSTAARKDVQRQDGAGEAQPDQLSRQPGTLPAGTQAPPVDTNSEMHGSSSTNDEPSPTAGPQAEAVHSQGTGAGTLAGREERSEADEVAAPAVASSAPDPLRLAGDEDPPFPGSFKNSHGAWRMEGCQKPDACPGMWNKRCGTCQKAFVAPHPVTDGEIA